MVTTKVPPKAAVVKWIILAQPMNKKWCEVLTTPLCFKEVNPLIAMSKTACMPLWLALSQYSFRQFLIYTYIQYEHHRITVKRLFNHLFSQIAAGILVFFPYFFLSRTSLSPFFLNIHTLTISLTHSPRCG